MNQSNKRSYAPPRPAAQRRSASRQAASAQRPVRAPGARAQLHPVPSPSRKSAPAPRRPIGILSGDVIKLAAFGAIAVLLAYGLQCFWPDGFPLAVNTNGALGVQSRVSEIHSTGALRINEIMTGNRSTLKLDDDSSPDWIEIMNVSQSAVNLEGYTLSRTADDGRTFTFPAMQLGGGECVLVYADSRSQMEAGDDFHAPFRLSLDGDTLMLFNAGGTAVDTVNIASMNADQSYARTDAYHWEICDLPTPGIANTQENYLALQQPTGDSLVVITEIMSVNHSVLADENGQYHDYIELYNRSGEDVDLAGWSLSDDVKNLRKWRFPSCTLGAGQYMVVFASGLNRTDDPEHLHTGFSLSSEGEQVVLTGSDGRIMDRVDFDLLKADTSYSLTGDGSWSSDLSPTPGRANQ